MRKCLLALVVLLLARRDAAAILQWDVELSDLDAVSCWNPYSCLATAGTVHMHNPADPADELAVDCSIYGPAGLPPVYQFQADADARIDCADTYIVDSLWASFDGPAFHYEFTIAPPPFTLFYQCGPNFPVDVEAPAGDGCDGDGWCEYSWTWDCLPWGQVGLTEDFWVPAGETLVIEPGIDIHALSGVRLIVAGGLQALGAPDSPITFHGDAWGGITFAPGSTGDLRHCRVTGVSAPGDGGALRVEGGAEVSLQRCIIDHDSCAGAGGAAFVHDGGSLSLFSCTVAHTTGGSAGGIALGGGTALLTAGCSVISHAGPTGTELTGTGAIPNVFSTDIYPQQANFPPGMPPVGFHCDPGYTDAAAGDFRPSYWNPQSPGLINCLVDAAPLQEPDPDGTAADLGAIPCDQRAILHPARDLTTADLPGDQGGTVLLSFHASRNDGGALNPVTLYSVWVRWPDASPDAWVAAGTVAAMGDSARDYTVPVSTLDDQFEGNENLHAFRVGTHSVDFPQPVFSGVVTGWSVDNLPPPAVEDVWDGGWYYDWPPTHDLVDVHWSFTAPDDFSRFLVWCGQEPVFESADLVYAGAETECTLSFPIGELDPYQPVYLWIEAVDRHSNHGPRVMHEISVEVAARSPWTTRLEPCAPNPFNPATRISFTLAAAGEVRLEVFNLTGQRMARLADGRRSAGRHVVRCDGSGWPSGCYIYVLTAPERREARRMLLLE